MVTKMKNNLKKSVSSSKSITQTESAHELRSAQPQVRRKLLKNLAIGSGAIIGAALAPEKWTAPIVNAVVLPAHAETSDIEPPEECPSCLVEAIYCEGQGFGSITVQVSVDGTVIVTHPNGTRTVTVDPCTGGDYSTTVTSNGGNTIFLSGSIPCGDVDSIPFVEVNGVTTNNLTLFKDFCVS